MTAESRRYLPALRFPALTRFFDPLVGLAMPERRFKGALIEQAAPSPGQGILDIGCGTGTLALMVKRAAETGRFRTVFGSLSLYRVPPDGPTRSLIRRAGRRRGRVGSTGPAPPG